MSFVTSFNRDDSPLRSRVYDYSNSFIYWRIGIILLELLAFSRQYCVTICGFLIPLNLLLTSVTLLLLVRQFPTVNLRWNAGLAMISSLAMMFHVYSWFSIGVVMTPTYLLLSLAAFCLVINSYAITAPQMFRKLLGMA